MTDTPLTTRRWQGGSVWLLYIVTERRSSDRRVSKTHSSTDTRSSGRPAIFSCKELSVDCRRKGPRLLMHRRGIPGVQERAHLFEHDAARGM